ncbi:MAG: glycosyltransferase family 4 protein, partial [Bacteroidales bacterium]|nr:glycosyltransferase family 4 protein [Bacteroidales bacterium]
EATFKVAGRNAPKEFAEYLGRNHVIFLGEIDSAADFFAHNSVFIVPLLSGSGMRIKIVEALAAAKIVITTTLGAEGISVSNGENIILSDTAEQFLEEMEKLHNGNTCTHIPQNARDFVKQNLDNKEIAKRLTAFYENAKA